MQGVTKQRYNLVTQYQTAIPTEDYILTEDSAL